MKNVFYFMIFTVLSELSGYAEEHLDEKAKINLKIYDVKDWTTNNYNIHIANISRSKGNETMKFGQLKEYNTRNIFL